MATKRLSLQKTVRSGSVKFDEITDIQSRYSLSVSDLKIGWLSMGILIGGYLFIFSQFYLYKRYLNFISISATDRP